MTTVLTIDAAREVDETIKVYAKAELELSKLPDNVKGQLRLWLKRGNCSALGGKGAFYYQVLAAIYEFPVFQLGRTDRCVVSFPVEWSDERRDTLVKDMKLMWKLSLDSNRRNHPHIDHWFRAWKHNTQVKGWSSMMVTRPKTLTFEGIATLLDLNDIREVVSKDARMWALSAVERGETVDVSRFILRRN